jgi:predicted transcriptional regulator/predicted DNA-binding transcriptional regulator
MGYSHSLATIQQYLQPLIEAELAGHKNAKYLLTTKGSEIVDLVGKADILLRFPANSSCLEELSLVAIKNGYRKFEDLAKVVDRTLLPRALNRLQKQGLIRSNHPKDHVQFYRVKVRLMGGGSPTERRVFHAVTPDSISVTDLSKAVGINIRRTYKYLARLKKRGLILQRKLPVTYELTQTGNTGTEFIEQVLTRIIDGPFKAILTPQIDLEESVMRRSLATIKQYGRKGILQSDLWRRLGLDSRKGSRQVLNLERRGFIERSRELNKGRWTYRLSANKGVATVDTVADIPCVSCEEDYKGICPTHDVNPAVCTKLTSWVIGLDH